MKYLLLFCCFIIFIGCATSKKKERHYNEYRALHLEQFAHDCGTMFHVEPTFAPGDTLISHDTTFVVGPVVPCPPAKPGVQSSVNCPPSTHSTEKIFVHDTLKIPDAAKLAEARLSVDRMQNELAKATARVSAVEQDRDKYKRRANWYLAGMIGFGLFFALSLFVKFRS